MYLKHDTAGTHAPDDRKPVHYDALFDVWPNGKGGAFLLFKDGTRQDYESAEVARLFALDSLKSAASVTPDPK